MPGYYGAPNAPAWSYRRLENVPAGFSRLAAPSARVVVRLEFVTQPGSDFPFARPQADDQVWMWLPGFTLCWDVPGEPYRGVDFSYVRDHGAVPRGERCSPRDARGSTHGRRRRRM